MGLRSIEGDEHYGFIGLGSMVASAADVYSATIIDSIIEPDLIVSAKSGRILEIDVDDVLVWDCKEWHAHCNASPDIIGGEDLAQAAEGGITKDSTVNGNQQPTADTNAEGTRPGGDGAAVTGAAAGGPGTRTVGDEQPTRYVERFHWWGSADEEQTAVGQLLHEFNAHIVKQNTQYRVDGNDAHLLLTAAHYHMWLDTDATGVANQMSLGMFARRMSIDLKELMFDRAVLLSILDALVVSS